MLPGDTEYPPGDEKAAIQVVVSGPFFDKQFSSGGASCPDPAWTLGSPSILSCQESPVPTPRRARVRQTTTWMATLSSSGE
jgi:hypothetical protein